jgi:transcriptional regulator with XRE-family HTH domain
VPKKRPRIDVPAGLPGLVAARKRAGLTQGELAEAISKLDPEHAVDKTSISQWETGRASPAGGRIVLVAEVLDCSIDELYREAS